MASSTLEALDDSGVTGAFVVAIFDDGGIFLIKLTKGIWAVLFHRGVWCKGEVLI